MRCGSDRSDASGLGCGFHARLGCSSSAGAAALEAVLGLLAGVGLLLAGVVVNVILIAVAGCVVLLACSTWAVTSARRRTGSTTGRAPVKDRGSGKRRHGARSRRPGQQAGSGRYRLSMA